MKKSNKKWDIVVLSPHLDDAVLSLGQHIIKWKKEGKKIKVVTVFTKFGDGKNIPNYSNDYLMRSGFKVVGEFEKARIVEDKMAMEKLGVDYEHWGFTDAGFRGVYESREKLLRGKIDNKDQTLVRNIGEKVRKIETNLLLIPYGVGGHVDHLIVKKVTEKMSDKNYYLDVPYLWQNFNWVRLLGKIIMAKNRCQGGENKRLIMKCYQSQYLLLNSGKLNEEFIIG